MFLTAVASPKYANIVTTLQSNVDSYRHPNNEYFLPQYFCMTNIATLINNNVNVKAHVHDLGQRCINRIAGWDSMYDDIAEDNLQFCHIQGYLPRVLCIKQGCDQGSGGRGPDHWGYDWHQGFNYCQDPPALSSKRGSTPPHGRFSRPNWQRCAFLPDKQCNACKRIGHQAINCDMLALALFI
jgi:hypothetical protein